MPNISYPDLDSLDPGDREIVEYGRVHSTPRPESQAIRAHVPAVLHAFTQAWRTTFLDGDLLKFEDSDRYSEREKTALRYTSAIIWDSDLADEALWAQLH